MLFKVTVIYLFLITCVNSKRRFVELGESALPFLVNLWVNQDPRIGQEKNQLCAAIQLTAYADYFLTPAKCFDKVEHDQWWEDIGVSYDEELSTYSRQMCFLTRYKEEGGPFVILERFEHKPLFWEQRHFLKSKPISKIIKIDNSNYSKLETFQINSVQTLQNTYLSGLSKHTKKRQVILSVPRLHDASTCYVIGWGSYLKNYEIVEDLAGTLLTKEYVQLLKPRECNSVDPAHICVLRTDRRTCVEDIGSPLICENLDEKNVSRGSVVIGMYTGFRNCAMSEKIVYRTFETEMSWIGRWAKGTRISTSGVIFPKKLKRQKRAVESRKRAQKRKIRSAGLVFEWSMWCLIFNFFYFFKG